MANPYINVYKNNPTAGGSDGTAISEGGTFTAPLSFTLDASLSESQAQKCAIRTENGYTTVGTTTISAANDTDGRLKFSDQAGDSVGSAELAISNPITDTNTIFYVIGNSDDSENPQTDRNAAIRVSCMIASVE